jgi:hypothetical protein
VLAAKVNGILGLSLTLLGCAATMPKSPLEIFNAPPRNAIPTASQFDSAEALALLEFCVNLDSQDDLHPHPSPKKKPAPVPPVRAIFKMREDRIKDWDAPDTDDKDSRVMVARRDTANDPTVDFTQRKFDSRFNGFGPFSSAWTLWHKKNSTTWALVFRGTVFESTPSVDEDVIVTTVAARNGLAIENRILPVSFADLPRAEVHEGFAYGLFSMLFDKNFGALDAVRKYVPAGSTLILAGHSQGAAVAVLAHAFLYQAQYYPDGGDPFGLRDKAYSLKSYTFAQPRPGNLQFALNFARMTGGGATSFAINNTIDPVPMVPVTHSFTVGAFEDSPNRHGWKVLRWLNNQYNRLHNGWNSLLQKGLQPEMRAVKNSHLSDYRIDPASWGPVTPPDTPVSQNYVTAGNVIPLVGHTNEEILTYYHYPDDAVDEFIQHHATTYRRLLEELLGLDPTTEAYMENQQPVREQ